MPVPFILLGIAVGAAVLAGCSSGEKKKPEAAKPARDAFAQDAGPARIDEDSYATLSCLWSSESRLPPFDHWQPRLRLYLGAAKDLLSPLCAGGREADVGAVREYQWEVKKSLAKHPRFQGRRNTEVDGVLVLLAALAPAELHQPTLYEALDTLGKGRPPQERHFREVLKAAYHFNMAAKVALSETRFTAPRVSFLHTCLRGCDIAEFVRERRGYVNKHLREMTRVLKTVDTKALNDRQREFLDVLLRASREYRESLSANGVRIYP